MSIVSNTINTVYLEIGLNTIRYLTGFNGTTYFFKC